jgi:hypothetical protein
MRNYRETKPNRPSLRSWALGEIAVGAKARMDYLYAVKQSEDALAMISEWLV